MPPTANDALAKALAPDPADGRRAAEHKAVLKARLERGLVSAEPATAELMLESVAKAAHRADPWVEESLADLDVFLAFYYVKRSHQDYRLNGRTPAQALRDALGRKKLPPITPKEDENAVAEAT